MKFTEGVVVRVDDRRLGKPRDRRGPRSACVNERLIDRDDVRSLDAACGVVGLVRLVADDGPCREVLEVEAQLMALVLKATDRLGELGVACRGAKALLCVRELDVGRDVTQHRRQLHGPLLIVLGRVRRLAVGQGLGLTASRVLARFGLRRGSARGRCPVILGRGRAPDESLREGPGYAQSQCEHEYAGDSRYDASRVSLWLWDAMLADALCHGLSFLCSCVHFSIPS